jgi:peptidoglycan/xylan/chitin deacetylase (PgdA/CDA1 family)
MNPKYARVLALFLCLAARLSLGAAASATEARQADSQHGGPMLTVLCYHHVDSSRRSNYSVTSAQLEAQIGALRAAGFIFVDSAAVEAFYEGRGELPAKAALVTFDDGNLDVYEHAYPLLKRLGVPFTVFVYPNAVNRGHEIRCMSWEDLRDLADHGVGVGSHSMSHPFLTLPPKSVTDKAAYDAWLTRELIDSKTEIEAKLGRPVTEFAVPFGAFDAYIRDRIKAAGYALAFNVHGVNSDSRADPWNLGRVIVLSNLSKDGFLELAASPPLYFAKQNPADLSRVDAELTSFAFELDGADGLDEKTVQGHVTSFPGLELRHVLEGDLFVETLDLRRPAFYEAHVSALDKTGRLRRGAWLFIYEKRTPDYLKP